MIIRRLASSHQLISQPRHAALAATILRHWDESHFPESPRKASILHAIEQHDSGWAEVDEALVVDPATGQLLDFVELPDAVKRDTSWLGLERLASDPYAAALVAQHRLHVYRRYAEHPDWRELFANLTAARESFLRASGAGSLDDLLRDYKLLRACDLASLAFCCGWTEVDSDGCGYTLCLEETSLFLAPDPFGGRTIEIEIEAREIVPRPFADAADARRAVESAPFVTLRGVVRGAAA
jgi:hypothetical protein